MTDKRDARDDGKTLSIKDSDGKEIFHLDGVKLLDQNESADKLELELEIDEEETKNGSVFYTD